MTSQKDRIESAIRHIQTASDVDPWAMELAVDALKAQDVPDTNIGDMISRQAAIDLVEGLETARLKGEIDLLYPKVVKGLIGLPSAQPEIVKCKDCKFYTPMNRETKTGICRLLMHQNFGDDWYCAGAERRTDEQDD